MRRFEKRFFPECLGCVPLNLTCCCFLKNSFQKLSRKSNFQLVLAVSIWYVRAQCLVATLLLCVSHGSKVVSSILMMHSFVWAVLYAIIFGVPPVLLPPLCNVSSFSANKRTTSDFNLMLNSHHSTKSWVSSILPLWSPSMASASSSLCVPAGTRSPEVTLHVWVFSV